MFYFRYATGPYLKSILLQEHIANKLLEQCAFQDWSWRIFDLKKFFQIVNGPEPYGPRWSWKINQGQKTLKSIPNPCHLPGAVPNPTAATSAAPANR